jgi:hypothetical protein
MAQKKREELARIGRRNQLMIFRGQIELAKPGGNDARPTLRFTHFNPTPSFLAANARAGDEAKAALVPIPPGVGIQVALPDSSALTPPGPQAGSSRPVRNVGVPAHSPSFNADSGVLTCSAGAARGEAMPDWEERLGDYRFYGPGRG